MEKTAFIEPFPDIIDAKNDYEQSAPLDGLSFELDCKIKDKIEAGREWSFLFSDALKQRLIGGPVLDRQEVADQLNAYSKWVIESHLSIDLFNLCHSLPHDSKDKSIIGRELGHSSFHIQNICFLEMWNHLLTKDGPITNNGIYSLTQKKAALQGSSDAQFRDDLVKKDAASYYEGQLESEKSFMEGLLGEHDSGVVLLQAAKTQKTNWIVIPAPATFEYLSSGLNSDYIVISPKDNQVVGVQVKNRITDEKDIECYDKSRVVLVDTSVDFGNQKHVQYRTKDRGTIRRTVGYNGLMCFESLRMAKLNKNELLATAGLANYAQSRSKDYNKRLVKSSEIIKNRILEKMQTN